MSEERKHIDIGDFFMAEATSEGKVWIGRQDAEGGEFDVKVLEVIIKKFYEENF